MTRRVEVKVQWQKKHSIIYSLGGGGGDGASQEHNKVLLLNQKMPGFQEEDPNEALASDCLGKGEKEKVSIKEKKNPTISAFLYIVFLYLSAHIIQYYKSLRMMYNNNEKQQKDAACLQSFI